MPRMKKVTIDQYTEKLTLHKGEVYQLSLPAWQVPILHGLIALAADHPGIIKQHECTHQTISEIREWCKKVFQGWGFDPEQVEYLDKMREAVAK